MAKLTISQVASRIGKSVYTIKRWYNWYETTDKTNIEKLVKEGMPLLPEYETIGATNWRYWNENDISKLEAFRDWMPHTRQGVMGELNRKEEK